MLKMLRYDFYKIFKSKALLSLLLFSFALSLIKPIATHLVHSSSSSVLENLRQGGLFRAFFWIFLVPFTAKDYSSNYIININAKNNKIYYILSKVFYIFIISLIMVLLDFLFEIFFNYAFDQNPLMYDAIEDRFTIKQFIVFNLAQVTTCTALGVFALLLTTIFKKEYIPVVFIVLYDLFLSDYLYEYLNKAFYTDLVERFVIFGFIEVSCSDPLNLLFYNLFIPIGYTVLFVALSYLILRLRKV